MDRVRPDPSNHWIALFAAAWYAFHAANAETVAACERALAITPESPLARNNLAVARAQLPKAP